MDRPLDGEDELPSTKLNLRSRNTPRKGLSSMKPKEAREDKANRVSSGSATARNSTSGTSRSRVKKKPKSTAYLVEDSSDVPDVAETQQDEMKRKIKMTKEYRFNFARFQYIQERRKQRLTQTLATNRRFPFVDTRNMSLMEKSFAFPEDIEKYIRACAVRYHDDPVLMWHALNTARTAVGAPALHHARPHGYAQSGEEPLTHHSLLHSVFALDVIARPLLPSLVSAGTITLPYVQDHDIVQELRSTAPARVTRPYEQAAAQSLEGASALHAHMGVGSLVIVEAGPLKKLGQYCKLPVTVPAQCVVGVVRSLSAEGVAVLERTPALDVNLDEHALDALQHGAETGDGIAAALRASLAARLLAPANSSASGSGAGGTGSGGGNTVQVNLLNERFYVAARPVWVSQPQAPTQAPRVPTYPTPTPTPLANTLGSAAAADATAEAIDGTTAGKNGRRITSGGDNADSATYSAEDTMECVHGEGSPQRTGAAPAEDVLVRPGFTLTKWLGARMLVPETVAAHAPTNPSGPMVVPTRHMVFLPHSSTIQWAPAHAVAPFERLFNTHAPALPAAALPALAFTLHACVRARALTAKGSQPTLGRICAPPHSHLYKQLARGAACLRLAHHLHQDLRLLSEALPSNTVAASCPPSWAALEGAAQAKAVDMLHGMQRSAWRQALALEQVFPTAPWASVPTAPVPAKGSAPASTTTRATALAASSTTSAAAWQPPAAPMPPPSAQASIIPAFPTAVRPAPEELAGDGPEAEAVAPEARPLARLCAVAAALLGGDNLPSPLWLLGREVAVWRAQEGAWYRGRVRQLDVLARKYFVVFATGCCEWLQLDTHVVCPLTAPTLALLTPGWLAPAAPLLAALLAAMQPKPAPPTALTILAARAPLPPSFLRVPLPEPVAPPPLTSLPDPAPCDVDSDLEDVLPDDAVIAFVRDRRAEPDVALCDEWDQPGHRIAPSTEPVTPDVIRRWRPVFRRARAAALERVRSCWECGVEERSRAGESLQMCMARDGLAPSDVLTSQMVRCGRCGQSCHRGCFPAYVDRTTRLQQAVAERYLGELERCRQVVVAAILARHVPPETVRHVVKQAQQPPPSPAAGDASSRGSTRLSRGGAAPQLADLLLRLPLNVRSAVSSINLLSLPQVPDILADAQDAAAGPRRFASDCSSVLPTLAAPRCPRCLHCEHCGEADRPGDMVTCDVCGLRAHWTCTPGLHAQPPRGWVCVACVKCKDCDSVHARSPDPPSLRPPMVAVPPFMTQVLLLAAPHITIDISRVALRLHGHASASQPAHLTLAHLLSAQHAAPPAPAPVPPIDYQCLVTPLHERGHHALTAALAYSRAAHMGPWHARPALVSPAPDALSNPAFPLIPRLALPLYSGEYLSPSAPEALPDLSLATRVGDYALLRAVGHAAASTAHTHHTGYLLRYGEDVFPGARAHPRGAEVLPVAARTVPLYCAATAALATALAEGAPISEARRRSRPRSREVVTASASWLSLPAAHSRLYYSHLAVGSSTLRGPACSLVDEDSDTALVPLPFAAALQAHTVAVEHGLSPAAWDTALAMHDAAQMPLSSTPTVFTTTMDTATDALVGVGSDAGELVSQAIFGAAVVALQAQGRTCTLLSALQHGCADHTPSASSHSVSSPSHPRSRSRSASPLCAPVTTEPGAVEPITTEANTASPSAGALELHTAAVMASPSLGTSSAGATDAIAVDAHTAPTASIVATGPSTALVAPVSFIRMPLARVEVLHTVSSTSDATTDVIQLISEPLSLATAYLSPEWVLNPYHDRSRVPSAAPLASVPSTALELLQERYVVSVQDALEALRLPPLLSLLADKAELVRARIARERVQVCLETTDALLVGDLTAHGDVHAPSGLALPDDIEAADEDAQALPDTVRGVPLRVDLARVTDTMAAETQRCQAHAQVAQKNVVVTRAGEYAVPLRRAVLEPVTASTPLCHTCGQQHHELAAHAPFSAADAQFKEQHFRSEASPAELLTSPLLNISAFLLRLYVPPLPPPPPPPPTLPVVLPAAHTHIAAQVAQVSQVAPTHSAAAAAIGDDMADTDEDRGCAGDAAATVSEASEVPEATSTSDCDVASTVMTDVAANAAVDLAVHDLQLDASTPASALPSTSSTSSSSSDDPVLLRRAQALRAPEQALLHRVPALPLLAPAPAIAPLPPSVPVLLVSRLLTRLFSPEIAALGVHDKTAPPVLAGYYDWACAAVLRHALAAEAARLPPCVPAGGDWGFDGTTCAVCTAQCEDDRECPLCCGVWYDGAELDMVECCVCSRWVHCRCDRLDNALMDQAAGDNVQYVCRECLHRRKTGLLVRVLDALAEADKDGYFLEVVSEDIAPGYSDLIKVPMAFSTIRHKLSELRYATVDDFRHDLNLIWRNARDYNGINSVIAAKARELQALSMRLLQAVEQAQLREVAEESGRLTVDDTKKSKGRRDSETLSADQVLERAMQLHQAATDSAADTATTSGVTTRAASASSADTTDNDGAPQHPVEYALQAMHSVPFLLPSVRGGLRVDAAAIPLMVEQFHTHPLRLARLLREVMLPFARRTAPHGQRSARGSNLAGLLLIGACLRSSQHHPLMLPLIATRSHTDMLAAVPTHTLQQWSVALRKSPQPQLLLTHMYTIAASVLSKPSQRWPEALAGMALSADVLALLPLQHHHRAEAPAEHRLPSCMLCGTNDATDSLAQCDGCGEHAHTFCVRPATNLRIGGDPTHPHHFSHYFARRAARKAARMTGRASSGGAEAPASFVFRCDACARCSSCDGVLCPTLQDSVTGHFTALTGSKTKSVGPHAAAQLDAQDGALAEEALTLMPAVPEAESVVANATPGAATLAAVMSTEQTPVRQALRCAGCLSVHHPSCVPAWLLEAAVAAGTFICGECLHCSSCQSSLHANTHKESATTYEALREVLALVDPSQLLHAGELTAQTPLTGKGVARWDLQRALCPVCSLLVAYNYACPDCGVSHAGPGQDDMMACDCCNAWVHEHCEGLTDEQREFLRNEDTVYLCRRCRRDDSPALVPALERVYFVHPARYWKLSSQPTVQALLYQAHESVPVRRPRAWYAPLRVAATDTVHVLATTDDPIARGCEANTFASLNAGPSPNLPVLAKGWLEPTPLLFYRDVPNPAGIVDVLRVYVPADIWRHVPSPLRDHVDAPFPRPMLMAMGAALGLYYHPQYAPLCEAFSLVFLWAKQALTADALPLPTPRAYLYSAAAGTVLQPPAPVLLPGTTADSLSLALARTHADTLVSLRACAPRTVPGLGRDPLLVAHFPALPLPPTHASLRADATHAAAHAALRLSPHNLTYIVDASFTTLPCDLTHVSSPELCDAYTQQLLSFAATRSVDAHGSLLCPCSSHADAPPAREVPRLLRSLQHARTVMLPPHHHHHTPFGPSADAAPATSTYAALVSLRTMHVTPSTSDVDAAPRRLLRSLARSLGMSSADVPLRSLRTLPPMAPVTAMTRVDRALRVMAAAGNAEARAVLASVTGGRTPRAGVSSSAVPAKAKASTATISTSTSISTSTLASAHVSPHRRPRSCSLALAVPVHTAPANTPVYAAALSTAADITGVIAGGASTAVAMDAAIDGAMEGPPEKRSRALSAAGATDAAAALVQLPSAVHVGHGVHVSSDAAAHDAPDTPPPVALRASPRRLILTSQWELAPPQRPTRVLPHPAALAPRAALQAFLRSAASPTCDAGMIEYAAITQDVVVTAARSAMLLEAQERSCAEAETAITDAIAAGASLEPASASATKEAGSDEDAHMHDAATESISAISASNTTASAALSVPATISPLLSDATLQSLLAHSTTARALLTHTHAAVALPLLPLEPSAEATAGVDTRLCVFCKQPSAQGILPLPPHYLKSALPPSGVAACMPLQYDAGMLARLGRMLPIGPVPAGLYSALLTHVAFTRYSPTELLANTDLYMRVLGDGLAAETAAEIADAVVHGGMAAPALQQVLAAVWADEAAQQLVQGWAHEQCARWAVGVHAQVTVESQAPAEADGDEDTVANTDIVSDTSSTPSWPLAPMQDSPGPAAPVLLSGALQAVALTHAKLCSFCHKPGASVPCHGRAYMDADGNVDSGRCCTRVYHLPCALHVHAEMRIVQLQPPTTTRESASASPPVRVGLRVYCSEHFSQAQDLFHYCVPASCYTCGPRPLPATLLYRVAIDGPLRARVLAAAVPSLLSLAATHTPRAVTLLDAQATPIPARQGSSTWSVCEGATYADATAAPSSMCAVSRLADDNVVCPAPAASCTPAPASSSCSLAPLSPLPASSLLYPTTGRLRWPSRPTTTYYSTAGLSLPPLAEDGVLEWAAPPPAHADTLAQQSFAMLRVGAVTVHSLGALQPLHAAFHSPYALLPLGFTSTASMPSCTTRGVRAQYSFAVAATPDTAALAHTRDTLAALRAEGGWAYQEAALREAIAIQVIRAIQCGHSANDAAEEDDPSLGLISPVLRRRAHRVELSVDGSSAATHRALSALHDLGLAVRVQFLQPPPFSLHTGASCVQRLLEHHLRVEFVPLPRYHPLFVLAASDWNSPLCATTFTALAAALRRKQTEAKTSSGAASSSPWWPVRAPELARAVGIMSPGVQALLQRDPLAPTCLRYAFPKVLAAPTATLPPLPTPLATMSLAERQVLFTLALDASSGALPALGLLSHHAALVDPLIRALTALPEAAHRAYLARDCARRRAPPRAWQVSAGEDAADSPAAAQLPYPGVPSRVLDAPAAWQDWHCAVPRALAPRHSSLLTAARPSLALHSAGAALLATLERATDTPISQLAAPFAAAIAAASPTSTPAVDTPPAGSATPLAALAAYLSAMAQPLTHPQTYSTEAPPPAASAAALVGHSIAHLTAAAPMLPCARSVPHTHLPRGPYQLGLNRYLGAVLHHAPALSDAFAHETAIAPTKGTLPPHLRVRWAQINRYLAQDAAPAVLPVRSRRVDDIQTAAPAPSVLLHGPTASHPSLLALISACTPPRLVSPLRRDHTTGDGLIYGKFLLPRHLVEHLVGYKLYRQPLLWQLYRAHDTFHVQLGPRHDNRCGVARLYEPRASSPLDSARSLYQQYQLMLGTPAQRGPIAGHSLIHMWGLFAGQDYKKDQMIVEYQGEVIQQPLPDWHERRYEALDIDSCYMFMVGQKLFVDSTIKGNASRFINHSCDPNCYTRILDGKIVIFAKLFIPQGAELTYDYCFSTEEERITCTCGSEKCSGRLN